MIKARRSVLYLPADKLRVLEKAQQLDADCLIFDLEDAVSPSNKLQAREQLLLAFKSFNYGKRELVIRINALNSQWGCGDLESIIPLNADAVLLPKVESCAELEQVNNVLQKNKSSMAIWAMVETAKGVEQVSEYSKSKNLQVLVMGTNDLSKELRVPQTLERTGFLYSLSRCVLAARVNELDIIDGVYTHFKDDQGLQVSCEQGKELGFDGKTLIHPAQLDICNQVFSPSEKEIEDAQQVVDAWQEASQQGLGVVVVNGRLVEQLHVDQAQRCLDLVKSINK